MKQVTVHAVPPDEDGSVQALLRTKSGVTVIASRPHKMWGGAVTEVLTLAKIFDLQVVRFGGSAGYGD